MSNTNRLFAVAIAVMAVALVFLMSTFESDTDRVEQLGQAIKCPVCQGESIGDSPAQMARDMMALVSQRVDEGASDQEIVDELLASYSGAVLLDPPASGSTLLLWLAPAVVLVVGVGVILWWRRNPTEATQPEVKEEKPRKLAPILFLAGSLAAIVVVAGFFVQDRDGPNTGAAAIDTDNLEEVSNETMEAVIAANADHPEVSGMRLALAERYFEVGDFSSAFPHYLEVAQSPDASDPQAVTALVRLGWMAWEGNREVDAAVGLFDEALAIDDTSATALFLKGQVLWCSATDLDEAASLFGRVLEDPTLESDTRSVVESDLDALNAGAACT